MQGPSDSDVAKQAQSRSTGMPKGGGQAFDVVVIGGGHNGLVCAFYLASAGLKTLVIERASVVGGAAAGTQVSPRVNVCLGAAAYGLLRPEIIDQMNLKRFGLRPVLASPQAYLPRATGGGLAMGNSRIGVYRAVRRISSRDARALLRFSSFINKGCDVLRPHVLSPDFRVRVAKGVRNWPPTWNEIESRLEQHGAHASAHMVFHESVLEFSRCCFESDEMNTITMFPAMISRFASPATEATALNLFVMSLTEIDGRRGAWGFAAGGMGSVARAIEAAATGAGVTILRQRIVNHVIVRGGRAEGVLLDDGSIVRARVVVSAVDPKKTFLSLLDRDEVDSNLRARIEKLNTEGNGLKLVYVLKGLPPKLREGGVEARSLWAGFTIIANGADSFETAFRTAYDTRGCTEPFMEVVIPTLSDTSIAPPGVHVIHVYAQHFPYSVFAGRPELCADVTKRIQSLLEDYLGSFSNLVEETRALFPADVESTFGMTGGHVDHVEMDRDHMFSSRPVPELGFYRAPVHSLYLTAAGTHPGGTVTGAPGYNCAQTILTDLKLGKWD